MPNRVITSAELIAAGSTFAVIAAAVKTGELKRIRRDVYVDGPSWRSWEPAEQHAACVEAGMLRIRRPTVASRESRLFMADLPALATSNDVALTATTGHPKEYKSLSVHVADVPPQHLEAHDVLGLPATTIPRAVVDIGRQGSLQRGLVAADGALRQGGSRDELRRVVEECHSLPGTAQALRVLDLADPRSESAGESISRAMFIEHELEIPELQVTLAKGSQGPEYRVDFLWRRQRVIGEFDGKGKYDDPLEKRREEARQVYLEGLGYVVIRWGWDDVMLRAPETVARIRHALELGLTRVV
jgi:hypothetical protein